MIVRVANGAAPVTLSLRCGRQTLQLEARAPGTREFLRASIDYDHVEADDEQRFNLVVQRVRRRVGAHRIAGNLPRTVDRSVVAALRRRALIESTLVRVRGEVPSCGPIAR